MAAPKTVQDFLDLLERLFPYEWITPKKDTGDGYELLRALASIGARVSEAISHAEAAAFFMDAAGPGRATCNVLFSRSATGASPQVVMKAGTIVKTSQGGYSYVTTQDVFFLATDPSSDGPVRVLALGYGYEWNVRGPYTTAGGELVPGLIDTIELPLQTDGVSPYLTFLDPTIQVEQVDDAVGGVPPALDQLGIDVGLTRVPGESDAAYRERLRTIPDVVTPAALRRAAQAVMAPVLAAATLLEPFSVTFQTCWSAPVTPLSNPDYDPNLFCYNDPRGRMPFRNRWHGIRTFRGCFLFTVPNLPAIKAYSPVWNDTSTTEAGFHTSLGRRATSAYNVPTNMDPTLALFPVWNGPDMAKAAVYKGLYDAIKLIKAAGIFFTLELLGYS